MNKGTLQVLNAQTIGITSLNLGAESSLIVAADPQNANPSLRVTRFEATTANITTGAQIGLSLQSLLLDPTKFTVVKAGTLTSGTLSQTLLQNAPFLYVAQASADTKLGEVYLANVTHAYGGTDPIRAAGEGFRERVSEADLLVHPQDDRERDRRRLPAGAVERQLQRPDRRRHGDRDFDFEAGWRPPGRNDFYLHAGYVRGHAGRLVELLPGDGDAGRLAAGDAGRGRLLGFRRDGLHGERLRGNLPCGRVEESGGAVEQPERQLLAVAADGDRDAARDGVVDAPAEAVRRWLTEYEFWPARFRDVKATRVLARQGGVARVWVKSGIMHELVLDIREVPDGLAYTANQGDVHAAAHIRVVPTADGRTDVTIQTTANLSGFLGKLVPGGMLRSREREKLISDLSDLHRLAAGRHVNVSARRAPPQPKRLP